MCAVVQNRGQSCSREFPRRDPSASRLVVRMTRVLRWFSSALSFIRPNFLLSYRNRERVRAPKMRALSSSRFAHTKRSSKQLYSMFFSLLHSLVLSEKEREIKRHICTYGIVSCCQKHSSNTEKRTNAHTLIKNSQRA